MPLMLFDLRSEQASSQYGPDAWLPAGRTVSIASTPETVIKRELWRYLRGEVEGRSFLIAGHRGSGKTTVILRAVADVEEAILAPAAPDEQAAWMQRPLLVKLHGPSLFSGHLPAPPTPKRTSDADGEADGSKPGTPDPAAPKASKDTAPPSASLVEDQTRAALVQLATALYRALAGEVARRFRTHAGQPRAEPGEAAATRSAERLELAARLRLELDRAPGPEALRGYYLRMGRLRQGVLWPDIVVRGADQGAREIVAIATAAQAFQVCSGAITYEQVSKDTGERSLKVEGKGNADLKGLADRFAGIAAGVAVGAAVKVADAGTAPALAAGVAGGLLTALTLSWSSSRTDRRDESAEYRFIRDFSLATLDRDLPDVIRRLRDAGLAPVFVIDELDKLADVRPSLESLIDRLKNLTTDYGFFCFLTNRSYYEDLWWRMRRSAYPKEFTYFSNLLFVRNGAPEVLRYLLQVVRQAPGAVTVDVDTLQRDATAWMTFAFAARHRTRMNTIALMRELSLTFDEHRRMLPPPDLVASVRARLQAGVQVAVDVCLETAELSERIAADPLFGQLAVDALYRVSAAWEAGEPEVRLGPSDLAAYLRSRSDAGAPPSAAAPPDLTDAPPATAPELPASPTDGLSPEELGLLSRSAIQVARLLADFGQLQATARGYWTTRRRQLLDGIEPPAFVEAGVSALGTILDSVLPKGVSGIVETAGGPDRFVFRVDPYGALLKRADAGPSPQAVSRAPTDLLETCDAILTAFERLGVTIAVLVETGCLPATVAEASLAQAMDRLREAPGTDEPVLAGSERDLPTLRSFVDDCVGSAPTLSWTILLARLVAPPPSRPEQGLRAVARHLPVREIRPPEAAVALNDLLGGWLSGLTGSIPVPAAFAGNPASVKDWTDALLATGAKHATALPRARAAPTAWSEWRPRVLAFLGGTGPSGGHGRPAPPSSVANLQEAAKGIWPGALFRRQLDEVGVMEWSSLALRSFPLRGGKRAPSARSGTRETVARPPSWTFLAALAALRFDRDILSKARSLVDDEDSDLAALVEAAHTRAPDQRGILWLIRDAGSTLSREAVREVSAGVLAVTRDDVRARHPLLKWLSGQGAFDLVTADEEE